MQFLSSSIPRFNSSEIFGHPGEVFLEFRSAWQGKPRYFTYLVQIIDQHNYPEITTLTLGRYNFVLQRALKGEYALPNNQNLILIQHSIIPVCHHSQTQD